jgi:hypothetical protein
VQLSRLTIATRQDIIEEKLRKDFNILRFWSRNGWPEWVALNLSRRIHTYHLEDDVLLDTVKQYASSMNYICGILGLRKNGTNMLLFNEGLILWDILRNLIVWYFQMKSWLMLKHYISYDKVLNGRIRWESGVCSSWFWIHLHQYEDAILWILHLLHGLCTVLNISPLFKNGWL